MHTAFVSTSPRSTPGLGSQGAAVFCFTLGMLGTTKGVTASARARPAVDVVAPHPKMLSADLDNTNFDCYGGGDETLGKDGRDVFSLQADGLTRRPTVRAPSRTPQGCEAVREAPQSCGGSSGATPKGILEVLGRMVTMGMPRNGCITGHFALLYWSPDSGLLYCRYLVWYCRMIPWGSGEQSLFRCAQSCLLFFSLAPRHSGRRYGSYLLGVLPLPQRQRHPCMRPP